MASGTIRREGVGQPAPSLPFAVIGAGRMGARHIAALRARGIEPFVVDPSQPDCLGCLDDLPGVSAAIVATPTSAHTEIVTRLLSRGVHVLVEKPIAASVAEAERMTSLATDLGLVLAVGHVERFNPAYFALSRAVRSPRLIQAERLSPYTPHVADGVVADLMVHDLDLVCALVGETPTRVQGTGRCIHSETWDVATAVLEFACGTVATVTASRITADRSRRIAVSDDAGFFVADLLRREMHGAVVSFTDPLSAQLDDFLRAIREHGTPSVTGYDALRALRLVEAVEGNR